MTLEEAKQHIGDSVIYKPFKDCDKSQWEYGTITSVNDRYVFVRYGRDNYSKATRAEDLEI